MASCLCKMWKFKMRKIPCFIICLLTVIEMCAAQQQNLGFKKHKTDSLTILMFLFLMLLVVLTIWLFKHHRFRFVHETGLAIIYGLIVGAIIWYTSDPDDSPIINSAIPALKNYTAENPPISLLLLLPTEITNRSKHIQYDLFGPAQVQEDEGNLERIGKGRTQLYSLGKTVSFNRELFWNIFLPLIIFNAGYSMKRKHFFRNIGAVMAYAFIGTTISCIVVGGIIYALTRLITSISSFFTLTECFYFGALISATDPVTVLAIFSDLNVDVDLYAIIFGESVLNDAVAIVLTRSISKYGSTSENGNFEAVAFFSALGMFFGVMAGAFAIGALLGCLNAILTKYTKIKDHPLLETALFCLVSFSAFEAAEAADLSGIVAVLFCGITQAHYTFNNLSKESQIRTKQLFDALNFLSENFVFLYIGVSVFTFQPQSWNIWFILAAFIAIVIGRFCNVYPLSFLLNVFRKNKISYKFQNMMMFSGLRGAIAFALSTQNMELESRQYMLTTTMMIVLFTVILCGGFTTPMLQWLQIRVGVEEEASATDHVRSHILRQRKYESMELRNLENQMISQQTATLGPATSGVNDKAWLAGKWYNFDRYFMKPLLTHSRPTLIDTLPKCCLPLSKLLTTNEQLSECNAMRDEDSDTDIIIDNEEMSFGDPGSQPATPTSPDHHSYPGQAIPDDGDLGLGSQKSGLKLELQIGEESGSRV